MKNHYYQPKFAKTEDFIKEFNKIYPTAEKCAELLSVGTFDHTLDVHQDLTNEDLLRRFQSEKEKEYLSTFYVPAEGLWWGAVRTKLNDIAKWYVNYKPGDENNNKKQMYAFTIIFPNPVGHGLDAVNRKDYDCRVANFVITRSNQGIGIKCVTAHPAIEKAIELEHDAAKAEKISTVGHFCYEDHLCIDIGTELAAAKDDVGKKFASIASIMSHWKPENEKSEYEKCYFDHIHNKVFIQSKKQNGKVVLHDNLKLTGSLLKEGDTIDVRPSVVKKYFPDLAPYIDKLTELVCMAKDKKREAEFPETISEAEYTGKIKYLDTTHPISEILGLPTETKVNVVFQDTAESRDGYILQADRYKNKQKDQQTIFVDKETGERVPLDPEGIDIEYKVRKYDSIPGPNSKDDRSTAEPDVRQGQDHSRDKELSPQSHDDR